LKPRVRTLLLCAFVSLASVLLTLFVFFGILRPSERPIPKVPFSEFLTEVRVGHVEEIRIDETDYVFRIRSGGQASWKQAFGPRADIAMVRGLRPTDPSARRPKVLFER
jgi:hypothetical protein